MAKLPGAFNASDHGDMGFDPLPKGDYTLRIKESEYKQNSKKTGNMLSLKMEVVDGKYKGRTIYRNLNLENESKTAVEIAQKELASICRACGFPNGIDDSEELHGVEFGASIYVKVGKGDNPDSNDVSKYFAVGERPASPGASSGAASKPSFEDEEEEAPPTRQSKKPIFDDEDD